ncbi:MAG TPA: HPr kinase/phosphatase C-terminal domain-containing protein [Alphaproteobacteria bacterium]|jgi:serine kinase of HPr protein (carbohydrate metabolism regulator)|nr:HPr kinase/phosphatase C-terminal domain-containing protein [Alphaproteobacteria bacterium]
MTDVHGTSVVVGGVGVLLRGPPGIGKSDLALRLIDGGARLIADDQTSLSREIGDLVMTSNAVLEGLLEVRGVGILAVPCVPRARLGLVVDLVPMSQIERMPEKEYCDLLGVRVRLLKLPPFAASTAAKLRLAVASLDL